LNEKLVEKAKIPTEIDWASPRVICVAESYNKFDLDTADLLPMNIELYRYCLYENELLTLESEAQPKLKISTSSIFDQKEKPEADLSRRKFNIRLMIISVELESTRANYFAISGNASSPLTMQSLKSLERNTSPIS